MLRIFDDIVGLPLLPPYCSLRFYPYIIPGIEGWKKRIQRKKDLTRLYYGGSKLKIAFKVWIDNNGKAFGEGPYQLLKRIETTGSLTRLQ